ncbi:MAG: RNA polymerase factor sigma-54, partial [Acidiferrobacterales bacterium]|nr:RNA polymerase factor sigma-54 [Acidiferrobacterales bacterium]
MKQSLEFKLGQQLTITPQLQQAIRLLQLSSVELQQEIQEALESNPLLEETEEFESRSSTDEPARESGSTEEGLRATDNAMDDGQSSAEADYEPDWNEAPDYSSASTTRSNLDDSALDIDSRNSAPQTLTDHLLWQMHMTPFSERDQAIAEAIIDAINDDGYLTCSLEDIRQMANEEDELEIDEIEAVLHQVQNFDPVGVGARDLAECLQLQLRLLADDTVGLEAAKQLATPQNLNLLANRDQQGLRKNLKLTPQAIQEGA